MSLTIGQIPIAYLGGPTTISCISPTERLTTLFDVEVDVTDYASILLLGDEHSDVALTCRDVKDCQQNKVVCTSTVSPLWFRILDSLSFDNYKVNYFIEHNIHTKLFDTDMFENDDLVLQMFQADFSPMTYVSKYHPKCFSQKTKEHCMTSNIQYHVCDIRMYSDYMSCTNDHRNRLAVLNQLMILKDNPHRQSDHQKLAQWLSKSDGGQMDELDVHIPYPEVDNPHYPYFESYLCYVLERCLSGDRIYYPNGMKFFDDLGIDLLQLAVEDHSQWLDTIFEHPRFLDTSIIVKQIKQTKMNVDKGLSLFRTFCEYHRAKCPVSKELKTKLLKGIEEYTVQTFYQNMYVKRPIRSSSKQKPFSHTISELTTAAEELCIDLMLPFADFYMWVRSIKPSLKSVLTVYNAGEYHTVSFTKFFAEHAKLYTIDFASSTSPNSGKICHPFAHIQRNLAKKPSRVKLEKCLHFGKHVSLDDILFYRFHNNPAFETNMKLTHMRVMILGQLRYLQMLRGKPFTDDELEQIRLRAIATYGYRNPQNTHLFTMDHMKQVLQIKPMYLPEAYQTKYTLQ
jgi:hypothetical protein